MAEYNYSKYCYSPKLETELKSSSLASKYSYLIISDTQTTVGTISDLTTEEETTLAGLVTAHTATPSSTEFVRQVIYNSIEFGVSLVIEFATENVLLGITQAGMTTTVRNNMIEVLSAIQTGSLYDARSVLLNLPEESKDSTFITNARIIQFVNKIETYLGLPLTTEL